MLTGIRALLGLASQLPRLNSEDGLALKPYLKRNKKEKRKRKKKEIATVALPLPLGPREGSMELI